jgi:PKD repeat protein
MINLSWVDNHDAEDGHDIERSADGSSWSPLAQLGAGAISYADGGLDTATTYYYRVQTVEGAIRSSFSNIASTTTLAVPPAAGFTYAVTYTEASFTDISSDSDGTVLGWSWDFGDGSGSNSQNPTHTYASGNTYVVKLTVTDNHGATATATQNVTVEDPPFANFYASSEITSGGNLSGNLNATKLNDGAVESVTERESGGKPANRHSWAEHRWTINIASSGDASVVINAWQSSSTDGDTFDFEWSSNGTNWSPVFNVSAISNPGTPRSFGLPAGTSGTVYVRVIDTNRARGNRSKDTIHVDLLMVQVANASGEAPNGAPANLAAEADSFDSINLSWDDKSDNESGFRIERRNVTDGGSFAEVGTTGVNGSSIASFTDTGLTGETTYEYRVIAFNGVGTSNYSNTASATTTEAPDIQLNASGRKVKGKHTVDLDWTISPASDMDIYQGASVIGSVTSETIVYTHNMSSKGGASYDYKVCKPDTTTCSNTVTVVF